MISRRKFTLIDAMFLVAATAVALVPIRYAYDSDMLEALSAAWTFEGVWEFALGLHWIFTPLLVTWSLALWLLRLRQPRPRLRRLFRQPGMAATTAILLSVVLILIKLFAMLVIVFLAAKAFARSGEGLALDFLFVCSRMYSAALCDALLAVWLVLWLGRVWRCEASWIDRAGRALGIFGVVYGLLFGWIYFMGQV